MDPRTVANVVGASTGKKRPLLVVTNEKNMTLLNNSFDFPWRMYGIDKTHDKADNAVKFYLQPAIDQAMCQMSEKFYGNYFSTFSRSIKARRSSHGIELPSCILGYDADCLLPSISTRSDFINSEVKTVSYVTSFWAETGDNTTYPHRKEIQAALLANINNPQFDQVVVLLDGVSENANCTHFYDEMRLLGSKLGSLGSPSIQKLSCVNIHGDQPTYFQIFNYTLTEAVLGDIVVLSNADQAFDDTVSKARFLNPSVLAVLGTRGFSASTVPKNLQKYYDSVLTGAMKRNMSKEEVDRCNNTPNSWDTFIFHRRMIHGQLKEDDFLRMNKANESVPFYMNEYGAENAALWGLQHHSNFTSIYNACDEINSWAFHLTKKMHKLHTKEWKTKGMYRGVYLVPEPFKFASKQPKCLQTGNCFVQSLSGGMVEG